jgi:hypothetical protein
LNSLEQTQTTLLTEFNRKALELEARTIEKMQARETELAGKYDTLKEELTNEYKAKLETINAREDELKKRESSFNTKEARYVARSEQQKQIEQIKGWLDGWSLTRGTRSKRHTVAIAYIIGFIFSVAAAVWFSAQNVEILQAAASNDLSKISWWQWVLLSLKSILPVAAAITFVIYFIRWSSSWARQHAEEEFRNRARILDIGRTAWLLEAVRDAQDNQKELPADLLKELSRNLFTYAPTTDGSELHPQAVTDLIMQGLASLRVKSGDLEVEAKRGKG